MSDTWSSWLSYDGPLFNNIMFFNETIFKLYICGHQGTSLVDVLWACKTNLIAYI